MGEGRQPGHARTRGRGGDLRAHAAVAVAGDAEARLDHARGVAGDGGRERERQDDEAAVGGKFNEQPCAKTRQKGGKLQPVAMLVMEDKVAGTVGIVETGPNGSQRRWVCPAPGAERVGKCVPKWQSAARA